MAQVENDTTRLLAECDAGTLMAVTSIKDVIDRTDSMELHRLLGESLTTHEKLGDDIHALLKEYHLPAKEPSAMASVMSKMKVGMKMMQENSDHTIADLMIDGCNMGIKSLSEYINQYPAADQKAKDMAKRLVDAEQALADELRLYL